MLGLKYTGKPQNALASPSGSPPPPPGSWSLPGLRRPVLRPPPPPLRPVDAKSVAASTSTPPTRYFFWLWVFGCIISQYAVTFAKGVAAGAPRVWDAMGFDK